jgi:hypothetical protein
MLLLLRWQRQCSACCCESSKIDRGILEHALGG